jgi:hypothetical protein
LPSLFFSSSSSSFLEDVKEEEEEEERIEIDATKGHERSINAHIFFSSRDVIRSCRLSGGGGSSSSKMAGDEPFFLYIAVKQRRHLFAI